jgi:hypothetical protein
LSSVITGLRKMEEEEFGEEEDIMREMEMMDAERNDGAGVGKKSGGEPGAPRKEVEVRKESAGGAEAEVGVSQAPPLHGPKEGAEGGGLLSGFDDEALYDSPDDGEKQRGGQPLRIFKKRGQKRTTRLANMRPTRAKRPAQSHAGEDEQDAEEEEGEDDDLVPETQLNPSTHLPTAPTNVDELGLSDLDSDLDFDGSASEEEENAAKAKPKKPTANKTTESAKGEGVVKRAVRKVKATAHANFKRLKLRNTGSKGGPGHNSRFRRRR